MHDAFEIVGDQIQFLHAQYICLAPIHILRREGGREGEKKGRCEEKTIDSEGGCMEKKSVICVREVVKNARGEDVQSDGQRWTGR